MKSLDWVTKTGRHFAARFHSTAKYTEKTNKSLKEQVRERESESERVRAGNEGRGRQRRLSHSNISFGR